MRLGPIMTAMDLYTSERNLLDRHRQRIVDAERVSRLLTASDRRHAWRLWTAARLRAMAERLDQRPPARVRRVF
jgi:hypothetical protein